MKDLKLYFKIGSPKWRITVKWCLIFGFVIGLLVGVKLILAG